MERDLKEGRVGLVQGWEEAQQTRGPRLGIGRDAMGLQAVRRKHAKQERLMERRGWVLFRWGAAPGAKNPLEDGHFLEWLCGCPAPRRAS